MNVSDWIFQLKRRVDLPRLNRRQLAHLPVLKAASKLHKAIADRWDGVSEGDEDQAEVFDNLGPNFRQRTGGEVETFGPPP